MPGGFVVLALVRDPAQRAWLERALAGRAELVFWDDAATLAGRVVAVDPDIVVLQVDDEAGPPLAPTIVALQAAFPLVPLVASGMLSPQTMHALIPAARAGVTHVIALGEHEPHQMLRNLVMGAPFGVAVRRARRAVAPFVPELIRPMVHACLEAAGRRLEVRELAQVLGVSTKTLAVRCANVGAPSPRRLIAWSTLLVAAQFMEDRTLSVEKIAHALGLESAAALRNLLRRYTGLRPGDVRARGGFACLARHFARALGATAREIDAVLRVGAEDAS